MGTRSAKELWQKLVDEAGEDEIERAASVSVAQAERELAEAGFDVAEERARAEAFLQELESGSPPTSEKRPAHGKRERRSTPPVVWIGAAAAAAAGVAVTYTALHGEGGSATPAPSAPSTPESPSSPGSALATATDLRRRAAIACSAGRAAECLSLLDRARDLDPAGDSAPDVRKLRDTATNQEPKKR